MRKISLIVILLQVLTVGISAATAIKESYIMINLSNSLLAAFATVTVYALFTVGYLYIIVMGDFNSRKCLKIAAVVWACSLAVLVYLFDNTSTNILATTLCILSFIIITVKSLKM